MAEPSTVTVTGFGSADAPVDSCRLLLGVEVTEPNPADAVDHVAAAQNAVLAAVAAAGGRPRQRGLSLEPQWEPVGSRRGGYVVSSTVEVVLPDPAVAGSVLRAAADVAGEALRVHGLAFEVSDPQAPAAAARATAFADAHRRAEQFARLAGASLGAVRDLVEGGRATPHSGVRFAATAAPAVLELPADTDTVTATVTVTWQLT